MPSPVHDKIVRMSIDAFLDAFIPNADGFEQVFAPDTVEAYAKILKESCDDAKKEAKGGSSGYADHLVARGWRAMVEFEPLLCPGHTLEVRCVDAAKKAEYQVQARIVPKHGRDLAQERGYRWWVHQRLHLRFQSVIDRPHTIVTDHPNEDEIVDLCLPEVQDIFDLAHRTCVYTVFTDIREFRLLRWDRTGVIISDAVDYTTATGAGILFGFLYDFSRMSEEEQGLDPTAVLLNAGTLGWKTMDLCAALRSWDIATEEAELEDDVAESFFEDISWADAADDNGRDPTDIATPDRSTVDVPPTFAHVRDGFARSLVKSWPRYVLTVGAREFLVCRPVDMLDKFFCRGTRAYIALDWRTNRIVFLKDAWRHGTEGLRHEGAVLEELNEAGVEHVPTVVSYEDLPGSSQETWTSYFAAAENKNMRRSLHSRIVVAEVYLELDQFVRGEQLTRIIENVRAGHKQAYERCGLLHGDISAGNIMIRPRFRKGTADVIWEGVLTDWEFSCPVVEAPNGIVEAFDNPASQGTHAFLSLRRSRAPYGTLRAADELESISLVLVHHAIAHLHHSCAETYEDILQVFFSGSSYKKGLRLCSVTKEATIAEGKLRWPLVFGGDDDEEHPMDRLIRILLKHFSVRYQHPDVGEGRSALSEGESAMINGSHTAVLALFQSCLHDRHWPTHDRADDVHLHAGADNEDYDEEEEDDGLGETTVEDGELDRTVVGEESETDREDEDVHGSTGDEEKGQGHDIRSEDDDEDGGDSAAEEEEEASVVNVEQGSDEEGDRAENRGQKRSLEEDEIEENSRPVKRGRC